MTSEQTCIPRPFYTRTIASTPTSLPLHSRLHLKVGHLHTPKHLVTLPRQQLAVARVRAVRVGTGADLGLDAGEVEGFVEDEDGVVCVLAVRMGLGGDVTHAMCRACS